MLTSKLTNFSLPSERGLFARYVILTAAIFVPLIWAFVYVRNLYPIAAWNVMMAGGDLERGRDYCMLRGETVSGETIDIPAIDGHKENGDPDVRHAKDDEPFSALAFKIMTDPFVGKLTYFRVYSGVLPSGSYIYNSTKDKRERIGRLLQMHANRREEIEELRCRPREVQTDHLDHPRYPGLRQRAKAVQGAVDGTHHPRDTVRVPSVVRRPQNARPEIAARDQEIG